MYCVYDDRNNIVAFHDDLDIVETYVEHVKLTNEDHPELHIGKIKKKKLKNLTDLDNLYLVRYSDTYVQSGYLIYLELISSQHIYDEQQCRDTLLKILECNIITDKERKSIERTVEVIDRFLQESKKFTPSLNELQRCEADYAPYMYNKYMFQS
jgi:hypothetical protein